MKKGWIILIKKEMTKLWLDNNFTAVTILEFPTQELKKIKTVESDWYQAAVISTKNGNNDKLYEFRLDAGNVLGDQPGPLAISLFDTVEQLSFVWLTKGKWYQWGIKRYGLHGMPATHGHKFTRHLGSKGNRKPRRTQKGHPHAWHMGMDQVAIKNIKIVEKYEHDNKHYVVVKWSIPGGYNSMLKCYIQ